MAIGDSHRPAQLRKPMRIFSGAANNTNGDNATPANAGVVIMTNDPINKAPDNGCPVATAKPMAQKTMPHGKAAIPRPKTMPRKKGCRGARLVAHNAKRVANVGRASGCTVIGLRKN